MEHLTVIDPAAQSRVDKSRPGMMHFAQTGPAGKTCFDCRFFGRVANPRKPELPRRCGKWMDWYKESYGTERAPDHPIDPVTAACSHFQQRTA